MPAVLASWERLCARYECVVIEGAGSPAEINLRDHDIANMGFAEAVDCPVLLVADIDRGGVFAHLVGTLELLSASERKRVVGFVINRFRGDLAILAPGLDWLERRTGKPVFGVLPYLHGLYLDAEDARSGSVFEQRATRLKVIAPAYPRLSNHNDLDPLRLHPEVDFQFIAPETPPPADLVVLPGSKAVRADLVWLRAHGWEDYLKRHLRYGGKLIGLCGGMQMLGKALHDPLGLEGEAGGVAGLGLLDLTTTFGETKQLRQVSGHLCLPGAPTFIGYEIHQGLSHGPALEQPAVRLVDDGRGDGAQSPDGQILATYCHGLFDHPDALAALLRWAAPETGDATPFLRVDPLARRQADLDRLADAVEAALDMDNILALLIGTEASPSTGAAARMSDELDTADRRHAWRMARKKTVIDDKKATATQARGVLVLHTGCGKGKSTAAFGVLARALGHGQTAAVVQFVKSRADTGETLFSVITRVCIGTSWAQDSPGNPGPGA